MVDSLRNQSSTMNNVKDVLIIFAIKFMRDFFFIYSDRKKERGRKKREERKQNDLDHHRWREEEEEEKSCFNLIALSSTKEGRERIRERRNCADQWSFQLLQ